MAFLNSKKGAAPVSSGKRPAKSAGEPRALLTPALMARVRQIQIRTHKLVNAGLSGGYRSTFRGQGIEFEEVRPYQPGDEVRAIDWNVTARTGEPYIKSYREERQLTIQLCVDTSLALDFATFGETKRDAASEVAALISFVGIRHQDRIGLTLFGQEPGLHLAPGRQSRHVLRMIREIQAAPITPGPSSLRSMLEGQEATLHRRSMVFVISDFSGVGEDGSERGDRGWVEALSRLSRRHDVIAIRLVDRFEEELPSAGIVRLARMEDGSLRDIDGRKKSVREAWSRDAAARKEALATVFRQARTEWIDMRTDGDLGAPLVRFFRTRVQGPRGGNQAAARSAR